jgi:hypothetical protein
LRRLRSEPLASSRQAAGRTSGKKNSMPGPRQIYVRGAGFDTVGVGVGVGVDVG